MRSLPRPAAFTLCLLAGVLLLAYLTLDLSPTSRRVPLIVVVPLLCLVLLELKRDVWGISAQEADAEETDARSGTERGVSSKYQISPTGSSSAKQLHTLPTNRDDSIPGSQPNPPLD